MTGVALAVVTVIRTHDRDVTFLEAGTAPVLPAASA
jgi:hypothetical protein